MLFRDSLHNICGLQCDYVTLPQIINSTSLFPCVWVDFAIALLSGIRPKRSCASWSGHFHWPYGFYSLSLIHQETTVRCINNLILPCCGSPGHAEKHQGVKHHCLRVEEWKRERGTPRHQTWEERSCFGSWSSVLVPSTGTSGSTTKAPSHNLINGLAAICYTARKKKNATASVIGFGAEQKLEAERSLSRLLRGAEKIMQELLSEAEEMLTCIIQCWKV